MRRRAGNMGRARCAEPDEKRVDAFARVAERQRLDARQRAQQDLQPAVAADVVEGRPALAGDGAKRRGQRCERMGDELRRAAGARGRHHPFGDDTRRARRGERRQRQAAGDAGRDVDLWRRRVAVMDQRVGLGRARERAERVRAGVPAGRARSGARRRRARSAPPPPWPCRRRRAATQRPSSRARPSPRLPASAKRSSSRRSRASRRGGRDRSRPSGRRGSWAQTSALS